MTVLHNKIKNLFFILFCLVLGCSDIPLSASVTVARHILVEPNSPYHEDGKVEIVEDGSLPCPTEIHHVASCPPFEFRVYQIDSLLDLFILTREEDGVRYYILLDIDNVCCMPALSVGSEFCFGTLYQKYTTRNPSASPKQILAQCVESTLTFYDTIPVIPVDDCAPKVFHYFKYERQIPITFLTARSPTQKMRKTTKCHLLNVGLHFLFDESENWERAPSVSIEEGSVFADDGLRAVGRYDNGVVHCLPERGKGRVAESFFNPPEDSDLLRVIPESHHLVPPNQAGSITKVVVLLVDDSSRNLVDVGFAMARLNAAIKQHIPNVTIEYRGVEFTGAKARTDLYNPTLLQMEAIQSYLAGQLSAQGITNEEAVRLITQASENPEHSQFRPPSPFGHLCRTPAQGQRVKTPHTRKHLLHGNPFTPTPVHRTPLRIDGEPVMFCHHGSKSVRQSPSLGSPR